MGLKTPLYDTHARAGAKIVDFGGWDMPLHYGSQLEEHHAVRRDAGVFDVSHMASLDIEGARATDFLRILLANDVAKLRSAGKGLYSCLLGHDGGVLDDLIVYRMHETRYRMVVNAGTREKDLAWIRGHADAFGVEVAERRDLAMLAVQGPQARAKTAALLAAENAARALALPVFSAAEIGGWFVARTGYTGEDGFEIALPAAEASAVWAALTAADVRPAGLGARDTLRLEAGLCLYGNDLDEAHDPIESGLAWTVAFDPPERRFIGRDALERAREAPRRELVGLLLEERGVLRSHQRVSTAHGEGEITSGGFAPTLNRSIALARLPAGAAAAAAAADGAAGARDAAGDVRVEIRGKALAARVVKPPFVRHGRPLISTSTEIPQ